MRKDGLLELANLIEKSGLIDVMANVTLIKTNPNGWWFFSMDFRPSTTGLKKITGLIGKEAKP